MKREIRMRAVRRQPMNDEKLALAFLLLARTLREHEAPEQPSSTKAMDNEEAA